MKDKFLISLLIVACLYVGVITGRMITLQDNVSENQHLIASMEEAKLNHIFWAEKLKDNKDWIIASVNETEQIELGNRQYHLNWVVIYDQVIKELGR